MLLNDVDLGSGHPFLAPDAGLNVQEIEVVGSQSVAWGRGGRLLQHRVVVYLKAFNAIGGQTALSISATRYALRSAEQIVRNFEAGPIYIRWTSTADTTALLSAADLADGWYWVTSFQPDYRKVSSGLVPVNMTVVEVAQGDNDRNVGILTEGSAFSSTGFSGAAVLAVGFPINTTLIPATSSTRTGGEGGVPVSVAPTVTNLPAQVSSTVGDWFKGGVRVYDTIG